MKNLFTPGTRKAIYAFLAAVGAVAVGYGWVSSAEAEQLITLGMAVVGLIMAAYNTDTVEPEGDHFLDANGDGNPDIKNN